MIYCDQARKMIVNLGSNKGVINYDSSTKLTHSQYPLSMIIVDTHGKDLSES